MEFLPLWDEANFAASALRCAITDLRQDSMLHRYGEIRPTGSARATLGQIAQKLRAIFGTRATRRVGEAFRTGLRQQTSFQVLIDPVEQLAWEHLGEIDPFVAGQIEERDQEIIEQVAGLVGAVRQAPQARVSDARISPRARWPLAVTRALLRRRFGAPPPSACRWRSPRPPIGGRPHRRPCGIPRGRNVAHREVRAARWPRHLGALGVKTAGQA
jgi:hypothetical protein